MNCDAYRILITGYIDKELSDSEMQTLKAHLTTCEACLQYLQRQETMEAALKRYSLFQETPEIPVNFASKVTEQLQDILEEEQPVSLGERVTEQVRAVVTHLVERWASSLKTRPFAWTASMSCFVLLFAGLLFFEVYQRTYQPMSALNAGTSETALVTPQTSSQLSEDAAPQMIVAQTQETPEKEEMVELVDLDMETFIRFEDDGVSEKRGAFDQDFQGTEASNSDKELLLRVAHNDPGSVEDYVYSHVIEINQDRLVDDVVFVGYVQDVSIQ